MGYQPVASRYLHKGKHKYTNRTQTPMPRVGFAFTPQAAFHCAKTVHPTDRVVAAADESTN
jgi:hypothetical protein